MFQKHWPVFYSLVTSLLSSPVWLSFVSWSKVKKKKKFLALFFNSSGQRVYVDHFRVDLLATPLESFSEYFCFSSTHLCWLITSSKARTMTGARRNLQFKVRACGRVWARAFGSLEELCGLSSFPRFPWQHSWRTPWTRDYKPFFSDEAEKRSRPPPHIKAAEVWSHWADHVFKEGREDGDKDWTEV